MPETPNEEQHNSYTTDVQAALSKEIDNIFSNAANYGQFAASFEEDTGLKIKLEGQPDFSRDEIVDVYQQRCDEHLQQAEKLREAYKKSKDPDELYYYHKFCHDAYRQIKFWAQEIDDPGMLFMFMGTLREPGVAQLFLAEFYTNLDGVPIERLEQEAYTKESARRMVRQFAASGYRDRLGYFLAQVDPSTVFDPKKDSTNEVFHKDAIERTSRFKLLRILQIKSAVHTLASQEPTEEVIKKELS